MDASYLASSAKILAEVLREHFGISSAPTVLESTCSLVTTRPEDLKPEQCIPHYDGGTRAPSLAALPLCRDVWWHCLFQT